MKKLITIMLLLCCVITVGAQTVEGKKVLAKAQAGDALAQGSLGSFYYHGMEGFSINKSEGIKWWRKSAEQNTSNSCYAMLDLASHYRYIINNKNEAIYWYKKLMDNWYKEYGKESEVAAKALRELGVYYHPDSKSSSTASSSSSRSSSGSSSSSSSRSSSSSSSSSGSSYTPEYGTRDVWVPCYGCNGTGFCSTCHGKGSCVSTWSDGSYNSTYKCPVCYGSGRCQTCYGMRGHNEKQMYQIR